MGFTGFYEVFLGFMKFYWVLLGSCSVLIGFIGFSWVLLGFDGFIELDRVVQVFSFDWQPNHVQF